MEKAGGDEGKEAKRKREKKMSTQPKHGGKKTGPHRMAQKPRAGMSDSVGRFRRYRCSTLFNFDSNLSMCGTFLIKLLPQTLSIFVDYCHVTYNLNLRAATLNMWSFRIPTAIFCNKNCTILGSLPSPRGDPRFDCCWYQRLGFSGSNAGLPNCQRGP